MNVCNIYNLSVFTVYYNNNIFFIYVFYQQVKVKIPNMIPIGNNNIIYYIYFLLNSLNTITVCIVSKQNLKNNNNKEKFTFAINILFRFTISSKGKSVGFTDEHKKCSFVSDRITSVGWFADVNAIGTFMLYKGRPLGSKARCSLHR